MTPLQQKRLVWLIMIPVALLLVMGGIQLISVLYGVSQRARVLDSALNLIEPRLAAPGRLEWLEDDTGLPRALEQFTREKITNDYLLANEELTFSLLTGDSSGLGTYFQEGALFDVLQSSRNPGRHKYLSWNHKLTLHFYAPDGATVGFTDRHYYAQGTLETNDLTNARIGVRELDVIATLDDGNWRIHHWRNVTDTPLSYPPHVFPELNERVNNIRGINYIARSAPFDALWPNLDLAEIDTDFARIQTLGFNTVRFFIPYPAPEGLELLPGVLDSAQTHGLKVIPTLLDTYTRYQLEDLPEILTYLDALTPALTHEAVLLIDVKNEADRDFKSAGLNRTRTVLGFLLNYVRAATTKPVTVGLITPDPVLVDSMDVVSLHHYEGIPELQNALAYALEFAKPVILEEFGFHSWERKLPDPHSDAEQAFYYQQVLGSTAGQAGWLAWTLYDLVEGDMPGGREVERHLGVLTADGKDKPVTRVLAGEHVSAPGGVDRVLKYRYFALVGVLSIAFMLVVAYAFWRFFLRQRT